MMNPILWLLIAAFVLTLGSAVWRVPLWVPVLLVVLALLLTHMR